MAKKFEKKFYGDNSVGSEQILIEKNQGLKVVDSTDVEVDLIKLGASDEVLVKGAQVSLKADLDQEIVDRAAGDASTLSSAQDYTDGEIDALGQALDANIQQEVSDRIAGDAATLASSQSYTDQEVLAEETARIAADSNLQSQIDAISGGGSGSLSALQSELDATQSGAGLDATGAYLQNPSAIYISTVTSLHQATQTLDSVAYGLDQGLSQEQTDRIAAVADLQDQINNVLSNVDGGALDSLTEIVSAFQAADASLNGAITALSTGLSADIAAEEAARIAADSALQGEIDAEEVARAAADTTLQNNINSEAAARLAADDALDARVDVLESVTWKKQKFAMSNGQVSITLAHIPVAGSVSMFVDQVPMHESLDAGATDDFSVSGTSVSFINDFSATGNKKMQNNDTVYVKYQYKA